jgi:hypothetical protein
MPRCIGPEKKEILMSLNPSASAAVLPALASGAAPPKYAAMAHGLVTGASNTATNASMSLL